MSCPNSDPSFDQILSKYVDIKAPDYPEKRKLIFYGICIWVRLILYTIVFHYREHESIPFIIGGLALFAVVHLYPFISSKEKQQQWWSRTWQFFISCLIVIVCIARIFFKTNPVFIPALLYISLFGGIIQSLFVTFC